MTYQGKVRNGVVEFPDGQVPPEGAIVRVEPILTENSAVADADEYIQEMLAIAGSAEGLPADLARNHDHYLYGRPKK
ncbi:MAG: hypothetical protein IT450_20305 [Phycisphaerales bacterium]|nr:hypothetical protein [Phycisphaerales bacterium]